MRTGIPWRVQNGSLRLGLSARHLGEGIERVEEEVWIDLRPQRFQLRLRGQFFRLSRSEAFQQSGELSRYGVDEIQVFASVLLSSVPRPYRETSQNALLC